MGANTSENYWCYSIPRDVFYFEAFVEDLIVNSKDEKKYQIVPKFPSAEFEITVLADKKEFFKDIISSIQPNSFTSKNIETTYIENIEYLDTYIGSSIDENKKAISLKITFRNQSKTIDGNELKILQDDIIKKITGAGYPLR